MLYSLLLHLWLKGVLLFEHKQNFYANFNSGFFYLFAQLECFLLGKKKIEVRKYLLRETQLVFENAFPHSQNIEAEGEN